MTKNVLVVAVNAVGMIGVLRSLGRAGYCTHAIAVQLDALGFHSNFAVKTAVCPLMESVEFVPWLQSYIRENNIHVIVPSEGFLHAISDHYHEFNHLLPDAVPIGIWQRCLSKVATQQRMTEALPEENRHLPIAGIVRDVSTLPDTKALEGCRGPFYVKADAGLAKNVKEAHVVRCETADDMQRTLNHLLPDYEVLLWQHYVPGKKVGVSLWRHDGEIIAENMTLGIHMQPWQGGMMSLRRSFWHEALLADAKRKMEILGWQGVAMMEYKWDPITDEFWFIEINARYWGYLHLDLFSGKDFPKLQIDAFFGDTRKDMGPPAVKQVCRHTVPGEIGYLLSRLKSEELGVGVKLKSLLGFFIRFLNIKTHSDLWFPGDRSLYIRCWINYLKQITR